MNFFKLATPGKDGVLVLDEDDEVIRGITVTLDGVGMWPPPAVSVSAAPKKEEAPAEATPAEEPKEKSAFAKWCGRWLLYCSAQLWSCSPRRP